MLNNTSGVLNGEPTNTLPVVIHAGYNNTWNYSLGANYHLNDQWLFRSGVGYDQTPTVNAYRNLQLPDSNRIALALGAHYQASKALGFDAGWTHVFAMNTRIYNVTQVIGDETVKTNGSVAANADVYALQVIWNFA